MAGRDGVRAGPDPPGLALYPSGAGLRQNHARVGEIRGPYGALPAVCPDAGDSRNRLFLYGGRRRPCGLPRHPAAADPDCAGPGRRRRAESGAHLAQLQPAGIRRRPSAWRRQA